MVGMKRKKGTFNFFVPKSVPARVRANPGIPGALRCGFFHNIGIKDRSEHRLPAPSFARSVLGFIRYPFGLRLEKFSFLALKDLEQVHSRRPPHLLEPLHRHDGGKGLALALDNKLVVA